MTFIQRLLDEMNEKINSGEGSPKAITGVYKEKIFDEAERKLREKKVHIVSPENSNYTAEGFITDLRLLDDKDIQESPTALFVLELADLAGKYPLAGIRKFIFPNTEIFVLAE